MSLRWLVAASAWLPAVRASPPGREKPEAWGAVQTPVLFGFKEAGIHHALPAVTPRPAPRGVLRKRDTNTCGYIDRNSMSAYICANSDAQCLYNDVASAVGCCLTISCNIYTTCVDSAAPSPTGTLADRTRHCTDSKSPSCAVLKYADPTDSLAGYTIPVCDTARTTYSFYLRSSGASTRRTSTRNTVSTSEPAETSGSSDADDATTNPTGTRGPAATTTLDPNNGNNQPPAAQQSSTPVGPIVGGVVGGVAALGLIGLGIFFIVRRKKQSPPSPPVGTVPPASAPGPGFMPPPGQGPYPNQAPPPPMAAAMPGTPGAFDPRYSMAKPPGASEVSPMQGPPLSPMHVSPSNSPSPVYHNPMQPMAAIPPHEQMGGTPPPHPSMVTPPPQQYPMGTPPPPGHGPYVPYPGPGPQHMQPPQHTAVELPTQRGDGQVHELS